MTDTMINRRDFLTTTALLAGGSAVQLACGKKVPASGDAGANAEAGRFRQRRDLLENARKNIAQLRQGEAVVRVVNRKGEPLVDVHVAVKQLNHAYRFGCYLTFRELKPDHRPVYQENFQRLFNYATVGVYWSLIQSVPSNADWAQVKPEIEWALSQQMRVKGHPLVWGANKAGVPRWLPQSKGALEAAMKQRVQDAVSRFRGKVSVWDVVNEPLDGGLFEEVLGSGYLSQAFHLAREADPQAQLVLNEYGIFSREAKRRDQFFNLLKKLKAEDLPCDAVGIQAHEPRTEWFDPVTVVNTLNQFADLGKQLHITEFTAQANTDTAITGGYRQGTWDEKAQADYYREFYTLCFGHPQVEAITAWGLDDERAWIKECALLDQRWQQKLAYQALNRLLNNEWRTMSEGRMTKDEYPLRGFYGDYEVSVRLRDNYEVKRPFSLRQGEKNEWRIEVA